MIMAKNRTHITQHRRRREGRTDYRQRLRLVKSGIPRLVVRRSSKGMVCQIIKHETKGDKTVVTVGLKELKKSGWKGYTGNVPASYLLGLICAKEAKKHKVKQAILDVGLHGSTKGSRLYAALKGAVDGGLEVAHSEEIFPDEKRITGEHIQNYAAALKKENQEEYNKRFSAYIKNKVAPETISKHFSEVKAKLLKS